MNSYYEDTQNFNSSLDLPAGSNDDDDDNLQKDHDDAQLSEMNLHGKDAQQPYYIDCNPLSAICTMLGNVDDSTRFALRIMASASLASLFILLPGPESDNTLFPEALWIVITAVIVSWQASPDIASVSKKMIQRLFGTIFGAAAGLALGGFSLFLEHGSMKQGLFLLACLAVGTFSIPKIASQNGYRGHYSATLGCVTFAIVLLAFFDVQASDGWRIGVFRMVNICIGGVLGGTLSLIFFPMSTMALIEKKVEQLVQDTGSTARSVLKAASDPPPRLIFLARKQRKEDESHERYMKSLTGWQSTRQLFDLLSYDPFYRRLPKERQQLFWEIFRLRLGRVLRIQAKLVVLDGLNRSKLHNVQHDELFEQIGSRLEKVVMPSTGDRLEAAQALIAEDLPKVRRIQSLMRRSPSGSELTPDAMSTSSKSEITALNEKDDDDDSVLEGEDLSRALMAFDNLDRTDGVPKFFDHQQTSALFFHLLEFVIIRILRLERYCAVTDEQWNKAERRE